MDGSVNTPPFYTMPGQEKCAAHHLLLPMNFDLGQLSHSQSYTIQQSNPQTPPSG